MPISCGFLATLKRNKTPLVITFQKCKKCPFCRGLSRCHTSKCNSPCEKGCVEHSSNPRNVVDVLLSKMVKGGESHARWNGPLRSVNPGDFWADDDAYFKQWLHQLLEAA